MKKMIEDMGDGLYRFDLMTDRHTEMVDITATVQDIVRKSGVQAGLCVVFVPHTTAGITINENADPDVQKDFIKELGKIVPWEDGYLHGEGNSAAHLKASMMGCSETVIIHHGSLLLGVWQGVYFAEYDGCRTRTVFVKVTGQGAGTK
jgi:secondary thiamine-phosphate synthase enzyme